MPNNHQSLPTCPAVAFEVLSFQTVRKPFSVAFNTQPVVLLQQPQEMSSEAPPSPMASPEALAYVTAG